MGKEIKILVVENEGAIAANIEMALIKYGYIVTSLVSTGEDAISQVIKDPPDLVLMDIMLAGELDGIETAEEIQKQSNIPIIYLTAHSDERVLERAKVTGPYAYIIKPFHNKELYTSIEISLQTHKIRTELVQANKRLQQEILERQKVEIEREKLITKLQNSVDKERIARHRMEMAYQTAQAAYDELEAMQTELINTNEKLEKSERKYRQLVELPHAGIWVINHENNTVYANPRMAEMLGYSLEEMQHKNLFDFMDERGRNIYRGNIRLRENGLNEIKNFELIKKDGQSIYTAIETSVFPDDDGFSVGTIAGVIDISELKKTQDELEQHRHHLEKLVILRTEELKNTSEDLRKTNFQLQIMIQKEKEISTMKDEFTDNVNHELRTPLTSLLMANDLLKDKLDMLTADEIKSRLEIIDRSGQTLLNLINELLDFSRLEAGRYLCQITMIDLKIIFERIKKTFEFMCKSKGLELIIEDVKALKFENDAEHVYKMLNNLVSNAYKFTNTGRIEMKADEKENVVWITVSDTGSGIVPDDVDYIFNRYHQGKIKNLKAAGTGIGLNMVKKMMGKHGGNVNVSSKLGKGSVFTLTFPKKSSWFDD